MAMSGFVTYVVALRWAEHKFCVRGVDLYNRTIYSNYLLLEKTRIIYAVLLQKELSGGHCADR